MSDAYAQFAIADVPSDLEWCIYDGEKRAKTIHCHPAAYMVVLMLRWVTEHQESGYEADYDGWKVFWKTLVDEHGHTATAIYLHKEKVVQYEPYFDKDVVEQEFCWVHLATIHTWRDKITSVFSNGHYGKAERPGYEGVRFLIEEAVLPSHWLSRERIQYNGDNCVLPYRLYGEGWDQRLNYTLERDEDDPRMIAAIKPTVTEVYR